MPASLHIPDELPGYVELFTEIAPVDSTLLQVNPLIASRFAALLVLLGEELPSGYWFQAGWGDNAKPPELVLSAREFAALARSSRIEEDTLYVVGAVSRETGGTGVGASRDSSGDHTASTDSARAARDLPVAAFAAAGPLRDQVVDAVLAGAKTATSSLLAEYSTGSLPLVGLRLRVVDSADADVAEIEIVEVSIARLHEIDLDFARDEGEGFASVAQWRRAHEELWRTDPHVTALGIEVTHLSLIVAVRFRLVEEL